MLETSNIFLKGLGKLYLELTMCKEASFQKRIYFPGKDMQRALDSQWLCQLLEK
jgi:hypothetical protein